MHARIGIVPVVAQQPLDQRPTRDLRPLIRAVLAQRQQQPVTNRGVFLLVAQQKARQERRIDAQRGAAVN